MITRGHYIGELIDEFANLSAQVKMRNALGYTDLSVYVENFFRDALNILLNKQLVNLNDVRSNEPGLDLGDELGGLGVQVTAREDPAKINSTLMKITPDQAAKFKRVVVLIVGKKRKSYTLDTSKSSLHSFTKKDIWDLDTVARKAISLELPDLQKLLELVRADLARVKVELEIPDNTGKYPTNGFDNWEKRITPNVGKGDAFMEFTAEKDEIKYTSKDRAETEKAIEILGRDLARLPRVTREFLVMLFERREKGKSKRFEGYWSHLLFGKVKREYHGHDLDGELDILEHAGFARINDEDPGDCGPAEIGVRIFTRDETLAYGFLGFVKHKKLSLRRVIGEIDLSEF